MREPRAEEQADAGERHRGAEANLNRARDEPDESPGGEADAEDQEGDAGGANGRLHWGGPFDYELYRGSADCLPPVGNGAHSRRVRSSWAAGPRPTSSRAAPSSSPPFPSTPTRSRAPSTPPASAPAPASRPRARAPTTRRSKRPVTGVTLDATPTPIAAGRTSGCRPRPSGSARPAAPTGATIRGATTPDCARANFGNYEGEGRCPKNPGHPVDVGSYDAGAELHDFAGNVWEWVADWYDARYYAPRAVGTIRAGPRRGERRVVRGGACCSMFGLPRASNRNCLPARLSRRRPRISLRALSGGTRSAITRMHDGDPASRLGRRRSAWSTSSCARAASTTSACSRRWRRCRGTCSCRRRCASRPTRITPLPIGFDARPSRSRSSSAG